MDSYKLTAKLRKARRQHTLSAGAQALFYELVAINNEEGWSNIFRCTNGELCGAVNVAEKTLIKLRDELVKSGLIGYKSGKSVRQPCDYSLNGLLKDLPNGGKIYSHTVSQGVSQTGGNVTDLYKTKSKRESKTLVVEVVEARAQEIEAAIIDFTSGKPLEGEKEKNSAQKEKVFPTHDEAMARLTDTAHWRNIVEHHGVTPEQRTEWFRIFYERHEDRNRIAFPSWRDMASHYYYWTNTYKNREIIQTIQNNANTKASTHAAGNTSSKNGNRNAANQECDDIAAKSAEFLQRFGGIEYP